MKRFLIVLILLVAAFLAGYGPLYFENRNLKESLEQTQADLLVKTESVQQRLRLSNLHSELGLLLIEIQQDNYGKARERASSFFDGLQREAFATQDENLNKRLTVVLQMRDEIVSDLASLNPQVQTKLVSLYQELFGVLREETAKR